VPCTIWMSTCHSSHCSWWLYILVRFIQNTRNHRPINHIESSILTYPTQKIHICLPGMPIIMETGLRWYGPYDTIHRLKWLLHVVWELILDLYSIYIDTSSRAARTFYLYQIISCWLIVCTTSTTKHLGLDSYWIETTLFDNDVSL